jgi:CDP-2,3-bis-(O-geranylgeranyl)-sn-glycerol synthase
MNLLFALIRGIWVIIPAYVANASAPLAMGKSRMDFGRRLWNNELLGEGKTWEGFVFAIIMGSFAGIIQILLWKYLNPIAVEEGFVLPELSLISISLIPFGAMVGDLIASFFKRRAGLERGARVPVLDQLDFLVGGFLVATLFVSLSMEAIFLLIIITPAIHFLTNVIGHKLGAKEVPW